MPAINPLVHNIPPAILDFLENGSYSDKQVVLELLIDDIQNIKNLNYVSVDCDTPVDLEVTTDIIPFSPSPHKISVPKISDYVTHIDDIGIDDELSLGILSELDSLNLVALASPNTKKPPKVKTQWLSPLDEPYIYGKNIINNPKPISNYPFISRLMDNVNGHPSSSGDMTAALVTCLSNNRAALRYHDDGEKHIAQNSTICTVSFGPPRTLNFIWKDKNVGKNDETDADFSFPAVNHTMNVMKPGCQAKLKHCVPPVSDDSSVGPRFSISFRNIIPTVDQDTVTPAPPPKSVMPRQKVVVMAGDSFFARLDPERLGKGKQKVVMLAKGGRKMSEVHKAVEDYVAKNPEVDIKSLYVSVGTNDIRGCNNGVNHLKTPLNEFMKGIKALAPKAKIYIQSLLPIPSNGNWKVEANVVSINNLIFNCCSKHKLYYVDVFNSFLNSYGNRNLDLFPPFNQNKNYWDIHPNKRGFGLLARHYIYLIHSKRFNPLGY